MNELTKKYAIFLLVLTCVLMSLLAVFGDTLFESITPKLWLFGSIFVFEIYEFAVIYFINKRKSAKDIQLANMYLAFVAGIFVLALILLSIYGLAVKIESRNFALLFVLVFIIYLIFSVLFLKNREKN